MNGHSNSIDRRRQNASLYRSVGLVLNGCNGVIPAGRCHCLSFHLASCYCRSTDRFPPTAAIQPTYDRFLNSDLTLQRLHGMRVSHVWFSDHSICYIELGSLRPGRVRPNGTVGNPDGDVTVFMGYDWLVVGPDFAKSRKYLHPRQEELEAIVAKIIGARIELAAYSDKDRQEIEIFLSTGLKILSVCTDEDGPDWSVTFNA